MADLKLVRALAHEGVDSTLVDVLKEPGTSRYVGVDLRRSETVLAQHKM